MKKAFIIFDLIILIIVAHVIFVLYGAKNMSDDSFVLNIEKDSSYSELVSLIDGVFNDKLDLGLGDNYINMYLRLKGYDSQLKFGKYFITNGNKSRIDVIKSMLEGSKYKEEETIKITEGWELSQISNYLGEKGFNDGTIGSFEFLSDVSTFIEEYDFLADAPGNANLEGYLFPDTYNVFNDTDGVTILRKMLDNFEQKVSKQMIQDIKDQGSTVYETLILASIIEKEVRTMKSKEIVSSIFHNRLDIGMALQSDATVNYITKSGRDRSTFEDLKVDSPYNTYKYAGLPPGPIGAPGLDSIKAAIYPVDTDYFYFLTTTEGDIYFAKTHDEHVANKNKYLN